VVTVLLAEFARAYAEGGLRTAHDRYQRARRERLRLRLLAAGIEALLPVSRLCAELLYYDEVIGTHGTGGGSRLALDRWGLTPRYELAGGAWRALSDGPFVAFGNHVTGVEAALFNSLFARCDIAHLAGTFIGRVGANLGRLVLPVHNTDDRVRYVPTSRRGRGLAAVEALIWPHRDDFAAKRENLATLRRTADMVVTGRAGVHLFPAGSMDRQAPWRSGIGHLVRYMLRIDGAEQVRLVPLVYGITDAHLLASRLFRRHPVRLLGRLRRLPYPPAPYVYAPEPMGLCDLGFDGRTPPERITGVLHERWVRARGQAATALAGWPASRRALASLVADRG
jgi:hypothetical protein